MPLMTSTTTTRRLQESERPDHRNKPNLQFGDETRVETSNIIKKRQVNGDCLESNKLYSATCL